MCISVIELAEADVIHVIMNRGDLEDNQFHKLVHKYLTLLKLVIQLINSQNPRYLPQY